MATAASSRKPSTSVPRPRRARRRRPPRTTRCGSATRACSRRHPLSTTCARLSSTDVRWRRRPGEWMDIPRPATETAPMSQYEIRATADIEPGLVVDVAELRRLTGGDVEVVSPGVITVLVVAHADDPKRLAPGAPAPGGEIRPRRRAD